MSKIFSLNSRIKFFSLGKNLLEKSFCLLVFSFSPFSASPTKAAENISITYGVFEASLKVKSLEVFAKEGKINKDLEMFLGNASAEQQLGFREALIKPIKLNPVHLSRFFYTDMGEDILTRIGNIVNIDPGLNGKLGIRAALVQAAFEPQGLTLLNVFQKFPTDIRLRGELVVAFAQAIDRIITETRVFSEELQKLSTQESKQESKQVSKSSGSIDFDKLPDLRKPGIYGVQPKQTWQLLDSSRNRKFYVDVYRPMRSPVKSISVLIFSHGLASRPEDFAERAKHWASYGYVVALPQHPGSDLFQAQALLKGYSDQVFELNEFVDRPKDISFVLDELARRNQTEFQGKLNLTAVGMEGHSFGGYTAFALAGAEIDFTNLQTECDRPLGGLNLSLLIQCRALSLPRQDYKFRDRRIVAILAANPIGSAVFGQKGLDKVQIPVMTKAGSYDPAAPAVFEEIRAFPWLTTTDKYLAMTEGQTHVNFAQLDAGIQVAIESLTSLTLPSETLVDNYANGMSLAFFGKYIQKEQNHAKYLQSSYAEYLSQAQKFKLSLISTASSQKLEQAIAAFRQK